MGNLKNTKPFYDCFRRCVYQDLCLSDRLRESGLDKLLCDVVQFCFKGEMFTAPALAKHQLAKLIHPDHSISGTIVKGKTIVSVSEWPSWLNQGHKKHVAVFNDLFYSYSYVKLPSTNCQLCNQKFQKSFWYHILYDCVSLHIVE